MCAKRFDVAAEDPRGRLKQAGAADRSAEAEKKNHILSGSGFFFTLA